MANEAIQIYLLLSDRRETKEAYINISTYFIVYQSVFLMCISTMKNNLTLFINLELSSNILIKIKNRKHLVMIGIYRN